MSREYIVVTGYFGAPIAEEAEKLAEEKGWPLADLDRIVEEKDGRSVARICMMAGEHGYRNREYEALEELTGADAPPGLVIACGDGVLYDDQSRDLIRDFGLVIAGEEMSRDCLWERARKDENTWHAFMKFGTDEEKRAAFDEYHRRQQNLFAAAREERRETGERNDI
ncbi:MAG: hypothetical protein IJI20_00200 [Firmicutes bacterium]|nr:hypothetical protein [Bacillota bacterium]